MVMEQHGNEVRVKNGFLVEAFLCDGKQHEKENAIPGSDVKLKEKTKAISELNKLMMSELGFAYLLKDGTLRVENSSARPGTRRLDMVPVHPSL